MIVSSAWPDPDQLTVLKAALLPPEEAVIHWGEFTASKNLQDLDHGCTQVLPMVYLNLGQLMQPDIDRRICQSAYKYVWANNHLLMHDAQALLLLLREHHIETCLLKGAAYVAHYYREYGMRVFGDIDILVSPENLPALIELFQSNQYRLKSSQDNADIYSLFKILHAKSFVNYRNTEFDIHQYLSPFLVNAEFTGRIWENKCSIDLFGRENLACVLSPTHQLLHTILHGLQYAPESSIRWIIDTVNLLNNPSVKIDWEEFVDVCDTYSLNLPVRQALPFIADEFASPIPDGVLAHFRNKPITDMDKKYYVRSGNLGIRNTMERMRRSWEHYKIYASEENRKTGKKVNLSGFYRFLLVYFDIKSPWKLVPHLVSKSVRLAARSVWATLNKLL